MDALTRHWKRLKDNPSEMFLLGSVVVCALLVWFVLAVRGYKQEKEQRGLWGKLAEQRQEPGQAFYISQVEMQQISMLARQDAQRAVQMNKLQGGREPEQRVWQQAFSRTYNSALMRRLYIGVPRIYLGDGGAEDGNPLRKPDLARPTDKVLEEIESLAALHGKKPIGAWLYFHAGNLRFARGHEETTPEKAKLELAKATEHYAAAKELLAGKEGHVLTDPAFNWLEKASERAASQEEWVVKLAKRRTEGDAQAQKLVRQWVSEMKNAGRDVSAADYNPVLLVRTTKGALQLELFLAENPALVTRVCQLVDSGYYDGREIYGTRERVNFGSPFDNRGSSELGPPARARILERTHTKGTVSMARYALLSAGSRARSSSTSAMMILKTDPSRGDNSLGGMWNNYDGQYSIIGQVTLADARRKQLAAKDQALDEQATFARLDRIARHGGLDTAQLLIDAALADEKADIERDAVDARRKVLDAMDKAALVELVLANRRDSIREEAGQTGFDKAVAEAKTKLEGRDQTSLVEEVIKFERLDLHEKAIEGRTKALKGLGSWGLAQAATEAGVAVNDLMIDAIIESEADALEGLGAGERVVSVRFVKKGAYTGSLVDWSRIGAAVAK